MTTSDLRDQVMSALPKEIGEALSMKIILDPLMPKDEIWFLLDGRIVAKIKDVRP